MTELKSRNIVFSCCCLLKLSFISEQSVNLIKVVDRWVGVVFYWVTEQKQHEDYIKVI